MDIVFEHARYGLSQRCGTNHSIYLLFARTFVFRSVCATSWWKKKEENTMSDLLYRTYHVHQRIFGPTDVEEDSVLTLNPDDGSDQMADKHHKGGASPAARYSLSLRYKVHMSNAAYQTESTIDTEMKGCLSVYCASNKDQLPPRIAAYESHVPMQFFSGPLFAEIVWQDRYPLLFRRIPAEATEDFPSSAAPSLFPQKIEFSADGNPISVVAISRGKRSLRIFGLFEGMIDKEFVSFDLKKNCEHDEKNCCAFPLLPLYHRDFRSDYCVGTFVLRIDDSSVNSNEGAPTDVTCTGVAGGIGGCALSVLTGRLQLDKSSGAPSWITWKKQTITTCTTEPPKAYMEYAAAKKIDEINFADLDFQLDPSVRICVPILSQRKWPRCERSHLQKSSKNSREIRQGKGNSMKPFRVSL